MNLICIHESYLVFFAMLVPVSRLLLRPNRCSITSSFGIVEVAYKIIKFKQHVTHALAPKLC